MRHKEICWETVEFLLHEALSELADIGARLEKARTGIAPQGWKRRLKGEDRLCEEALILSVSMEANWYAAMSLRVMMSVAKMNTLH